VKLITHDFLILIQRICFYFNLKDSPPPITDLGQSIYAIYPDVVLSQSSENEGELALVKSISNGISNTSLKELLAEAAEGNIEIQTSRYEYGDDDVKPVDSRDTGSSSQQFRELSIPEKMQVIFKLPRAEEILGGKWIRLSMKYLLKGLNLGFPDYHFKLVYKQNGHVISFGL
jgi:hypothetical protein